MDQSVINIIIAAVFSICGWVIRTLWASLKDLRAVDAKLADKVSEIELLVKGDYIRRHEVESKFEQLSHALFAKLDKISDQLDKKADK